MNPRDSRVYARSFVSNVTRLFFSFSFRDTPLLFLQLYYSSLLCIKSFEPNNPCRLQFSDSGISLFFFVATYAPFVSVHPAFSLPIHYRVHDNSERRPSFTYDLSRTHINVEMSRMIDSRLPIKLCPACDSHPISVSTDRTGLVALIAACWS